MFSMENRIGDFQEKIIEKFPDAAQILRRQLMFSDSGINQKTIETPEMIDSNSTLKIWEFKAKSDIIVQVKANSLAIISHVHKTYNNAGNEQKFRDTIDFVVSKFLEVIKIPIFKRVGLRYIDHCPVPTKNNEVINSLYNLALPSTRFPINDLIGYQFAIRGNRKKHKILYQEAIIHENGEENKPYILVLDFDGYEENIASKDYLVVTDELHDIISEEYFATIKEPIKTMMRTGVLP